MRICSGRLFTLPVAGVDKAVGWVYQGGKIDGHTVLHSETHRFGSRLDGSCGTILYKAIVQKTKDTSEGR